MPGGHLVALSQPAKLTDRFEAYVAELGVDEDAARRARAAGLADAQK